jgi:thiamine biosynthesis lipoprotein
MRHGLINRRALFTFRPDPALPARWLRVHRDVMACRFEVTLPEGAARHINAARTALDEADRIEAAFSLFRESSELSCVNRKAATSPVQVSEQLFALLTRCAALHAATEGAFDVTSGPLTRCWGFLDRDPHVPSDEDIEAARRLVGMQRVRLDADARSIRFDEPGVTLNLGAIGKGHALDRLRDVLHRHGVARALISAGGSSMVALGGVGDDWTIDLTSPLVNGRIGRLRLCDGALGTSGAGEQFVEADGTRFGHVVDPRTGWPAQGVLSATVVARDAETADALSTAFLIGGPPLAHHYCDRHPNTLALITPDDRPATTWTFGSYAGARIED